MNIAKIQKCYFSLYEHLKHRAITKYVRSIAKKWTDPNFKFTSEQEKEIRNFYAPYGMKDTLFHKWNVSCSGIFSPYYLPMDMYINKVDEVFGKK